MASVWNAIVNKKLSNHLETILLIVVSVGYVLSNNSRERTELLDSGAHGPSVRAVVTEFTSWTLITGVVVGSLPETIVPGQLIDWGHFFEEFDSFFDS